MHTSWASRLADEFRKDYFQKVVAFVKSEREKGQVFPPPGEVFTIFETVAFEDVSVVILGQDPYHGPGQAHGMSFSVKPGVKVPPSLANMLKEAQEDVGTTKVPHGYLRSWASQGVFLLNTVLTVRAKEAGSHRGEGWETFTDVVISKLNQRETPMVFLLWGKDAQNKAGMIDTSRHAVFTAAHPSPMSASSGFFGSKPFSNANDALIKRGLAPIDWQLPEDPNDVRPRPAPPTTGAVAKGDLDLDSIFNSIPE